MEAPNPEEFLDEDGNWVCTGCGACCLCVGFWNQMAKFDRGDGGCKHLNSRMHCRIYEDRPRVCRSRVMSPDASEYDLAWACAQLKGRMDKEIEAGVRSPIAKRWRHSCQSDTSRKV